MSQTNPSISVVIPVYNEEATLRTLVERLQQCLSRDAAEMIFVNDGSTDGTGRILADELKKDSRIRILNLSRNFGHQIALSAGIDHADGDVVITMDGDLQDPPELIPEMLARWREGHQVVYAIRRGRTTDNFLKRATASIFYRAFNAIANIDIPFHAGDFRLMDKRIVLALRTMPERTRFLRGMVPWLGFSSASVYYDRPPRSGGDTKYSLKKMLSLSLDGIITFSPNLLRISTVIGFLVMISSLIGALYVIFSNVVLHATVQGWSSIMVTVLFFGGIQLFTVGILSEYLGRVYEEVKQRPLYIIESIVWPSKLEH